MTDNKPGPAETEKKVDSRLEAEANAALRGTVPRLYSNGVLIAQSASDVSAILLANGTPVAVVSLSLITAKSLANELLEAVGQYEKATGEKVLTIAEVQKKLKKLDEEK